MEVVHLKSGNLIVRHQNLIRILNIGIFVLNEEDQPPNGSRTVLSLEIRFGPGRNRDPFPSCYIKAGKTDPIIDNFVNYSGTQINSQACIFSPESSHRYVSLCNQKPPSAKFRDLLYNE